MEVAKGRSGGVRVKVRCLRCQLDNARAACPTTENCRVMTENPDAVLTTKTCLRSRPSLCEIRFFEDVLFPSQG